MKGIAYIFLILLIFVTVIHVSFVHELPFYYILLVISGLLVGPVLIFPTATDIRLGSEKWSAGPAAIVVAFVNKWVLGGVIYNAWSYAGNSDRAEVNSGVFQYFINYNLPKAWYLSSALSCR